MTIFRPATIEGGSRAPLSASSSSASLSPRESVSALRFPSSASPPAATFARRAPRRLCRRPSRGAGSETSRSSPIFTTTMSATPSRAASSRRPSVSRVFGDLPTGAAPELGALALGTGSGRLEAGALADGYQRRGRLDLQGPARLHLSGRPVLLSTQYSRASSDSAHGRRRGCASRRPSSPTPTAVPPPTSRATAAILIRPTPIAAIARPPSRSRRSCS